MTLSTDAWVLLIVSLPWAGATARMRIWRTTKTLGCAALRDGANLLPAGDQQIAGLRELVDTIRREKSDVAGFPLRAFLHQQETLTSTFTQDLS